jgi:hypothetical protein
LRKKDVHDWRTEGMQKMWTMNINGKWITIVADTETAAALLKMLVIKERALVVRKEDK